MYAHQKAAVLVILLGCGLFFTVAIPAGDKAPTFSNEVVRIFQANCQVCHRPGEIAPFSLLTYRDAAPRALAIKRAVQTRRMPPWKPAADCVVNPGEVLINVVMENSGKPVVLPSFAHLNFAKIVSSGLETRILISMTSSIYFREKRDWSKGSSVNIQKSTLSPSFISIRLNSIDKLIHQFMIYCI